METKKNLSHVEELLLKILENNGIEPSKITPETNFLNDLGLDSLDLAELIMELELDLGIDIPDQDYVHFKTYQSTVEYLKLRNTK